METNQNKTIDKKIVDDFFKPEAKFMLGVAGLEQLPELNVAEIAFAGRSNVGKSSLINALLGRKGLARISSNPGCTQQLNFYFICNNSHLVDMPGYGFANASKQEVKSWNRLVFNYLSGRVNLRRVFLLIDSRRGVMDNDHKAMDTLDEAAVSYQVVLTKADEVPAALQEKMLDGVKKSIYKHPAALPQLILTSSEKKIGIDELRAEVFKVLN